MKKSSYKNAGFIINPNSRIGNVKDKCYAIKKKFPDAEIVLTKKKGDPARLAERMERENFDLVVTIGGDGTLNEVVNGLYSGKGEDKIKPTLGIIRAGTGNDFGRMLNIPTIFNDALDIIVKGKTGLFDLGVVKLLDFNNKKIKKCFLNISDFGIIGDVVLAFNNFTLFKKGRFGFVPYIISYVKRALLGRKRAVIMTIDDGEEKEYFINNVNIANGAYYGSGVKISPDSDPADGFFNLVILENMNPLEFTYSMLLAYRGEHLRLKNVVTKRVKRIKARPSFGEKEPIHIDLDGESPGKLPAEFYIKEKAINIIVP